MKRREEKWVGESKRGERAERAACQPNTEPFIDRCTPTPFFRSYFSSLLLFPSLYHSSFHSDFEHVACLFLSLLCYPFSSRFSFPLLSVLVFSSLFVPLALFTASLFRFTSVLIFSFSPSCYPSSLPQASAHLCAHVLFSSLCSPTASLGNRTEGGQRASTH